MASSDIKQLSLQSLKDEIDNKASIDHTHTFVGSIESALSLNGVTYDKFLRNDLKDEVVKAYYDNVSFGVAGNNTKISLKTEYNRAKLEVDNSNLETHNLLITGAENADVTVRVNGDLLINDSRVLTINDKDEITGVDWSDVDLDGKGIIVDSAVPLNRSDGTIWAHVIDDDIVKDDTPEANHTLYTLPVGSIIKTLSSVVPNGFIKADGREVSRNIYSSLWQFAKTKSQLLTEEDWQAQNDTVITNDIQYYSYANGLTTFRVPRLLTSDNTTYIIKAFDNLTTKENINLQAMDEKLDEIKDSIASSGVGFIKYPDGALIQYGIVTGGICAFSIAFLDDSYSVFTQYEGSAVNIDIAITNKMATKFTYNAYSTYGLVVSNAKINYLAIGRWK